MPQCEGIIPEYVEPKWRREVIPATDDAAETYEMIDESVTHPEHQCPEPAVALSVSMQQVQCDQNYPHWIETERRVYCLGCALPGTMTHLSGQVTSHPIQAIEN